MSDNKEKQDAKLKSDVDNQEAKQEQLKQEEKPKNKEKEQKEQDDIFIKRIKFLGNILLIIILTLIAAVGALYLYLINVKPESKAEIENAILNQVDNKIDLGNIIDSAVQTVSDDGTATPDANTVSTDAVGNRKVQNQNLIVLYDGLILDTSKMDQVTLKYIDNSSISKDKYVITYYNYENFSFKDSTLGVISDQIYDGLVKINKVGKVAISENYEAIPRTIKVVNSVPTIVMDNNSKLDSYDLVKTVIADLDGNGTEEYILVLANTATGYSKITMVDNQGIKVADLAYIEKSKWESVSREEYHLSISNVNIVDIDNDGVMELLIEIPQYEGEPSISLVKYKNGELNGKTNIACSLLP